MNRSRWLVVATLLVAAGLGVLAPPVAATASLVVAGLGFVAGIPHGALDHLLVHGAARRGSTALVAVLYAGTAVLAWLALQHTGPVALLAIVGLSAVHFGLGELEVWRATTGWRPGRITAAGLMIAGLGALLLPLAIAGPELVGVAAALSPSLAVIISAEPVRVALIGLWIIAATSTAAAAVRARHPAIALDIVLIGALGLLVPPLVAFAVWFGGWHALRHTGRLLTVEPGCAALVGSGHPGAAVRRFVRLAAAPTAAAVVVLVVLVGFTAAAPNPTTAVAEVLKILLALTAPHMLVVLHLDRRARVQESHLHAV